jgi:hypothetical protein
MAIRFVLMMSPRLFSLFQVLLLREDSHKNSVRVSSLHIAAYYLQSSKNCWIIWIICKICLFIIHKFSAHSVVRMNTYCPNHFVSNISPLVRVQFLFQCKRTSKIIFMLYILSWLMRFQSFQCHLEWNIVLGEFMWHEKIKYHSIPQL